MARVAILLLNYNGAQHLQRFLPSVIAHSTGYDIIVGDNKSTDNSLALLKSDFPEVKVIELAENYGYAGGYNRLIAQTDHEYIILLNSDVEVTPHWVEPMLATLSRHEKAVAVQPKILSVAHRQRFEYAGAGGGYLDQYGYPFCRGRIFGTLEEDHGQYDDEQEVFWASGACFMLKRTVFNETGGFDADFFAHMEEIDLCWRLQQAGYKIFYTGKSTVYHLGGGTLNYQSPHKTYLNYRNGWMMLLKNLPAAGRTRTLAGRWLLDLLSLIFYLVQFQVGNAVAVLRAHFYLLARRRLITAKRQEIRDISRGRQPIYPLPIALVWQYFIKRKRKFPDLIPD